jgi:hypothetical protein
MKSAKMPAAARRTATPGSAVDAATPTLVMAGLVPAMREHNMKHWSRTWKVRLILASNPEWNDLYDTIVQ